MTTSDDPYDWDAEDDFPTDPAPLDVHVEIQRLRGMFVPVQGGAW